MKFWYDTEFLENGRTIDLISIGMVAENGSEFYAVSSEFDQLRVVEHNWLLANVVPHLPLRSPRSTEGLPSDNWLDTQDPVVMRRDILRIKLLDFINLAQSTAAPWNRRVELRAWYGAYDHVALMQLWGSMMNKPDVLPMWTHDLRQRYEELGCPDGKPVQTGDEHDALADARWDREMDRWLDIQARVG